jgi:hypothetical protein
MTLSTIKLALVSWNGQDATFRMFSVAGIVLLLVALPETDGQP